MKPDDLKLPFKWSERTVVIHDRVFFVPQRLKTYKNYTFPGWTSTDFFGNDRPIKIEYCSGNGAWITAQALAHPQFNWIAVEMKWPRVKKIWSKTKNHSLSNLIVVCGEALHTTSLYLPDASVTEVFVNFPDPWPKKRHWKHRLINDQFLQEMMRILTLNGSMTFVTDDVDYSDVMVKEMHLMKNVFLSSFPPPFFATELSGYGSSYFEDLWRSKGRQIRYHRFEKRASYVSN